MLVESIFKTIQRVEKAYKRKFYLPLKIVNNLFNATKL